MKKKVIKYLLYCLSTILLFYLLVLLYFYASHSYPSYFTIYSQNFNEESFNKITIGEDKKIVHSRLGKPLRESISNVKQDSIKDVYWYTKARFYGSSYDKIYIMFYEDKVSNIIRVIDMD